MSLIARRLLRAGFLISLLCFTGLAYSDSKSLQDTMLLVAADKLHDPNFARSVVLVTRHNKNGPVGVIINRPLNISLQEIFPEEEQLVGIGDAAFFGGPVAKQTAVFLLRSETQPASTLHVFDDVYISFSKTLFEQAIARKDPTEGLRVYIGYAGWSEQQLQGEINRGDWYILPPDHDIIYSDEPDQLWNKLSKEFRGKWVSLPDEDDYPELVSR
jgi:putative transcriptional regulator